MLARVGPFHAGMVHRSFGFQAGNPLDEMVVKIGIVNVCVPDSLQGYLPGAGLHIKSAQLRALCSRLRASVRCCSMSRWRRKSAIRCSSARQSRSNNSYSFAMR